MKNDSSACPSLKDFSILLSKIESDPAFRAIDQSSKQPSFFRIIGSTHRERWHSAFWAWLLDPKGTHNLHDFAIKHFLLLAADSTGEIPSTRLLFSGIPRIDSSDIAPEYSLSENEPESKKLTINDIMNLHVHSSAIAPGPSTSYSEVSIRINTAEETKAKDSRPDILLVLHGEILYPDKSYIEPRKVTIYVVIEMKIKAQHDLDQLERYTSWLQNPNYNQIVDSNNQIFKCEVENLAKNSKHGEVWATGAFLCLCKKSTNIYPDKMWSEIQLAEALPDLLEEALENENIEPDAKVFLKNYINLLSSDMEETTMPIRKEHQKMVRELYARHERTFDIIQKVFTDALDDEGAKNTGEVLELIKPSNDDDKATVLSPRVLIESGLAKVGDTLTHKGVKTRGEDSPPFDAITVELVEGNIFRSYMLVDGPQELLEYLRDQCLAATTILDRVYQFYGLKYKGSGNLGLKFTSGASEGKTLSEVYDLYRQQSL